MHIDHLDPRKLFHAVLSQGRGLQQQCRVPMFGRSKGAAKLQEKLRPLEADTLQAATLGQRPATAREAFQQQHEGLMGSTTGLTGRWRKVKDRSDDMTPACDAVELPWILRKAMLLINDLELVDSPDHFETRLKAGGVLDVAELYPWTGEEVPHKRRDKRRGQHLGHVERTAEGPSIRVRWDEPYPGECDDTFVLTEGGDEMHQLTDMFFPDTQQRISLKAVFRRVHQ